MTPPVQKKKTGTKWIFIRGIYCNSRTLPQYPRWPGYGWDQRVSFHMKLCMWLATLRKFSGTKFLLKTLKAYVVMLRTYFWSKSFLLQLIIIYKLWSKCWRWKFSNVFQLSSMIKTNENNGEVRTPLNKVNSLKDWWAAAILRVKVPNTCEDPLKHY